MIICHLNKLIYTTWNAMYQSVLLVHTIVSILWQATNNRPPEIPAREKWKTVWCKICVIKYYEGKANKMYLFLVIFFLPNNIDDKENVKGLHFTTVSLKCINQSTCSCILWYWQTQKSYWITILASNLRLQNAIRNTAMEDWYPVMTALLWRN